MLNHLKNKFLIFAENIFELDIRYFLKGGFYQFSTYGVLTVLGFIISVLMARFWDKSVFGRWQFIVGLVNTLLIFSLTGMSSAVAVAVARKEDRSLVVGVKARFKYGLLASLVLIILSSYFFIKNDRELSYVLFCLSFIFPFYSSFDSIIAFFNAREEFGKSTRVQLVSKLLVSIIIILFLFFYNDFVAIVVSNYLILGLVYVYYYVKVLPDINKKEDPNTFNFGLKLSLNQLIPSLTAYADKILIPLFLTSEHLANYIIALSIPDLFNAGVKYLHPLIFPKVINLDVDDFIGILKKKFFQIFLMPVMVFIIAIIMSFFIPYIFGEKYYEVVVYSIIMSSSIVFSIFYSLVYNFLIAKKMVREIFMLQTSYSIIRFLLLVILIPFFGLMGASLVYTLSIPIQALLGFYMIKRCNK